MVLGTLMMQLRVAVSEDKTGYRTTIFRLMRQVTTAYNHFFAKFKIGATVDYPCGHGSLTSDHAQQNHLNYMSLRE